MTGFQAGVYDMPGETYLADPVRGGSLSASGAKRLLPPSCPALFAYEREHPPERAVFDFGHAAHKAVLGAGPEVAVIPFEDWRSKDARAQREEARDAGQVPVLTAEWSQVLAMAAAIREHPLASALFDPERGGKPEQSLFWQDPEFGIWRRARLDWLPDWENIHNRLIIPDYKTTVSASPEHIAKAVANYGYHQQDAWYSDGIEELFPGSDPAFLFVFQEKTPPYLVTVAELDVTARQAGRERNRLAMEVYRDCTEAGVWPGYTQDIELISLPAWALRQLETL